MHSDARALPIRRVTRSGCGIHTLGANAARNPAGLGAPGRRRRRPVNWYAGEWDFGFRGLRPVRVAFFRG